MSLKRLAMIALLCLWPAAALAQPVGPPSGPGQAYDTIQSNGSDLTQRSKLNCVGAGVSCADDSGNGVTTLTVDTTTDPVPAALYVAGHTYPAEVAVAADTEATAYWTTTHKIGTGSFGSTSVSAQTGEYLRVLGRDAVSSADSKFSTDFWFYVNSASANPMYLINKTDSTGSTKMFSVEFNTDYTGKVSVDMDTSSGANLFYYNSTLSQDTWYHVAVVYDNTIACGSGKILIYVNGSSTNSTQITCNGGTLTPVTDNDIHIGADYAGANTMDGLIDEVRIRENYAMTSGDVSTEYNSGSGRACTSGDSNLTYCWHLDDGVDTDDRTTIASQVMAISTVGDDGNNCTSSSTPCFTVQAALDKYPKFFGGNGTLYLASGTMVESDQLLGLSNNGEYTIHIQGYINPTPNSFSNSAQLTGTSSAAATNNFPLTTGSTFTDTTLSQFGSAGTLDNWFLHLTGNTGYDSTDDDNNWYVVETNTSSSVLRIVGNWKKLAASDKTPEVPDNTTTYDLYNPWYMSTINGSRIHEWAMQLISNRGGLKMSDIRFTGGRMAGLVITTSNFDYGQYNVWDEYFEDHDFTRLVFYNNGPIIGNGLHVRGNSHIGVIDTSVAMENRSIGIYINEHSSAESINHTIARDEINDSGYGCAMMCNIRDFRQNELADNGWAGMTVTIGGYLYRYTENYATGNYWAGLSVSDSASVAFYKGGSRYDPNLTYRHGSVFDSNTGHGIVVIRGASLNIAGGGTMGDGDIKVTNNGGYGILTVNATCVSCNGAKYSFSGNSDGDVYLDSLSSLGDITPDSGEAGNFYLSDNLTDSTSKIARIFLRHYDTSEEPFALAYGLSNSALNILNLGGGTSVGNAATAVRFFTAANNTTLTGTERMQIDSSGHVLFKANSPTPSSCGTTPTLTSPSSDEAGVVIPGTGTVTSCTITFTAAFTGFPICTLTTDHDNRLWISSWSTTAITITSANNMSGKKIFYRCDGRQS